MGGERADRLMATSGTATFTLDLLDIIEESFERVGAAVSHGFALKTARRSLDLLTKEWANRGINFWTIAESTEAIAAADTSSTLDPDTIDVLDVVWRTGSGSSQNDRSMTRISVSEWASIANKNSTGQPSQFWINRLATGPVMHIWPVPVEAGTLVYWKLRRIEDAGAYTNNMDIPPRFLPALVSGLAYYLAIKSPGAMDRVPMLQAEYERQFQLASEEDRERASLWLVPEV